MVKQISIRFNYSSNIHKNTSLYKYLLPLLITLFTIELKSTNTQDATYF